MFQTTTFVLGITVGFLLFYCIYFVVNSNWYNKIKTWVKDWVKKFWEKAGEILLYLGKLINGDEEEAEEPAETTTVDTTTSTDLLPFLKYDETKTPWYEQVAKRLGVLINPNTEVRDTVLEGLERNKQKYGKRFCPCMNSSLYEKPASNPATIVCPCYPMRHNGICHCGLFVQPESELIPGNAGKEIPSKTFKGSKYVFDENGKASLVPLTDEVSPPSLASTSEASTQEEKEVKHVSITASTPGPIPYVYDCIDFHHKKKEKEEEEVKQ